MDKRTLLIIDMQPRFDACCYCRRVIRACVREIKKARKRRDDILFVEFVGYGETHCELRAAAGRYRRKFTCHKVTDNGAFTIARAVQQHDIAHQHFVVCGVNADACVRETIGGLIDRYPAAEITAVADAINCDSELGEDNIMHRTRLMKFIDGYGVRVTHHRSLFRMRRRAA